MLDIVKDGEEIIRNLKLNINNYKQKEKFSLNKKELELTIARAGLNALVFDVLPKELRVEEFLFLKPGSSSNLTNYKQKIIDECFKLGRTVDETKDLIYVVQEKINEYTLIFNFRLSVDISLYDFIKMMKKSDRMREILSGNNFKKEMNAFEIMRKKEKLSKEIEDFILKEKIDPMYTFLTAEAAMRKPQFHDIVVGVGIRPNNKDSVYPFLINENWLNGLTNKDSFWAENDSARNALIIQKLDIRKTGTFNKRSTMLAQPNYLNSDPDYCCDTIHFVEEKIEDEKDFQRFIDLYHQFDGKPQLITEKDTHLIGKKILLRQPYTCNSDDGICHYCIGEKLYYDNLEGYHGGERNFGVAISKKKVAPKVQGHLSAKHNIVAKLFDKNGKPLTRINGEKNWHDYFDLKYINKLVFKDEFKKNIEQIKLIKIKDKGKRKARFRRKIEIKMKNDNTIEFQTNSVFYTEKSNIDYESGLVDDIEKIHIEIINNPVSSGYHELDKVFNKNNGNIQKAMKELKQLMKKEKAIVPYLLIRNIIRKEDQNEERPDYSKKEPKEEILTMQTAIRNFKELGLKLNIGFFKSMLSDLRNYEKTKPSKFDILFESRRKDKQ